ncbi:MAG: UbiD family decarboxylase [Thermodesulfobacteriota bacterium]
MAKDLRTFLEILEKEDQLYKIEKEVDPKTEMGTLVWEAAPDKAIFFEQFKGHPGWRGCGAVMATRDRLSMVLGVPGDQILPHYSKLLSGDLIKPVEVSDGPVKEVIWKGDQVDMLKLPIWKACENDAGPYLTWAETISRDPDTGNYNAAIVRQQIKGKNKNGIYCIRGRHTWINYKKYEAMNKPMPVAIVLGHHPAFHLAGLYYGSYETSEYEIASTLMGEPLRLVPCETVDLLAPADAEVVLEGEIPPGIREMEGPFQEFTNYYAFPDKEPIVNIKAITMRKDPIYEVDRVTGAEMHYVLGMMSYLYNTIKQTEGYIDLKDVHFFPQADHFLVVVQFTPHYEGQAKNVLLTALSGNCLHVKIAIAVDEDINIYEPGDVFWALANRTDPERDIFIVPGTRNHPFDLKLPLDSEGTDRVRVGAKVGIDATKPPTSKPEQRRLFERARPTGWGKVSLKDFLKTGC